MSVKCLSPELLCLPPSWTYIQLTYVVVEPLEERLEGEEVAVVEHELLMDISYIRIGTSEYVIMSSRVDC